MSWNKIDLIVKDVYGKMDIEFMPIFKETVKLFKEKSYNKILDIGCGYGKHSIYLAKNNFTVFSVDIDEQAIKWLKKYINENDISNINLIKANINNLPFENSYFDAIICSSVIHHQELEEIKRSISEIYRVLKQDGCILVNFMSIEDDSFGLGKEIEANTFVGSRKGEEDVPHHYTYVNEVNQLFKAFKDVNIFKNEYDISIDSNDKLKSKMLDVIAFKNN